MLICQTRSGEFLFQPEDAQQLRAWKSMLDATAVTILDCCHYISSDAKEALERYFTRIGEKRSEPAEGAAWRWEGVGREYYRRERKRVSEWVRELKKDGWWAPRVIERVCNDGRLLMSCFIHFFDLSCPSGSNASRLSVVMLGLRGAGKTSIVETLRHKVLDYSVMDRNIAL